MKHSHICIFCHNEFECSYVGCGDVNDICLMDEETAICDRPDCLIQAGKEYTI